MIVAAEWIFPVTKPPLFRHAIDIQNGIIQTIRPVRDTDPFLAEICILPGLVNAHVHLAYTALRNQFDDLPFFAWIRKLTEIKYQKLTEEDIVLSTRLGIWECLKAGITTVADLCDLEPAARALSQSPLRGIFYWEFFGIEKAQAQESWEALQETFPRLQQQYGGGKLRIGISPHACYTVRPELYRKAAEFSLQHQVPVSFHVAESKEEEEFIGKRTGVIQQFLATRAQDWEISGPTSVAHLQKTGIFQTAPLLAHLVQVSEEDLKILACHDVRVAHCPKSNAKFGHGIAPVIELQRKGLVVGIGTDSAASNNRLDLFEEARVALLQQRSRNRKMVLNEGTLLEMMTIDGARAMGLEKEIGSIEVGKQADLIAVRIPPFYTKSHEVLCHIIHNATAADVTKTIIGGKEINTSDELEGIRELSHKLQS